jgi:hypothetical protein
METKRQSYPRRSKRKRLECPLADLLACAADTEWCVAQKEVRRQESHIRFSATLPRLRRMRRRFRYNRSCWRVQITLKKRDAKTNKSHWHRHFFYRKESLRTTWKLRLSVLLLGILIVSVTRGFWTLKLAQSLVCKQQSPHSDALLLENFDPDYLVFERAAALRKAGVAARVFVPVPAPDDETPNAVTESIAEVMARAAWLQDIEFIPIHEAEPISLNAAIQIRDFLTAQHLKSVVVVSPGFRSRRSSLVYSAVFTPAGVTVGCVPVFGSKNPRNWTKTWHGIEDFAEQFVKLQYYRFYVLR